MTLEVIKPQAAGRWPTDLQVWHVEMPSSDIDIYDPILSESAHEHASQYRQPADRIRYMVTRVMLRKLLGLRLVRSGHRNGYPDRVVSIRAYVPAIANALGGGRRGGAGKCDDRVRRAARTRIQFADGQQFDGQASQHGQGRN